MFIVNTLKARYGTTAEYEQKWLLSGDNSEILTVQLAFGLSKREGPRNLKGERILEEGVEDELA